MSLENRNNKVTDLNKYREDKEIDQLLQEAFIERTYSPEAMERISQQLAVYAEQAGKISHAIKLTAEQGDNLSEESKKKIQECYDLLALDEFQLILNQYLPTCLTPAWMAIYKDVGSERLNEIMSSYKPLYTPIKNN